MRITVAVGFSRTIWRSFVCASLMSYFYGNRFRKTEVEDEHGGFKRKTHRVKIVKV